MPYQGLAVHQGTGVGDGRVAQGMYTTVPKACILLSTSIITKSPPNNLLWLAPHSHPAVNLRQPTANPSSEADTYILEPNDHQLVFPFAPARYDRRLTSCCVASQPTAQPPIPSPPLATALPFQSSLLLNRSHSSRLQARPPTCLFDGPRQLSLPVSRTPHRTEVCRHRPYRSLPLRVRLYTHIYF